MLYLSPDKVFWTMHLSFYKLAKCCNTFPSVKRLGIFWKILSIKIYITDSIHVLNIIGAEVRSIQGGPKI